MNSCPNQIYDEYINCCDDNGYILYLPVNYEIKSHDLYSMVNTKPFTMYYSTLSKKKDLLVKIKKYKDIYVVYNFNYKKKDILTYFIIHSKSDYANQINKRFKLINKVKKFYNK